MQLGKPVAVFPDPLCDEDPSVCARFARLTRRALVTAKNRERRGIAHAVEPATEQQALGAVGLGATRGVHVLHLRDHGDPVPFRDRLAEPACPHHLAQFWRIASPTCETFLVTLDAGRRLAVPDQGAVGQRSDTDRVPDGLQLEERCRFPGALVVGAPADHPLHVLGGQALELGDVSVFPGHVQRVHVHVPGQNWCQLRPVAGQDVHDAAGHVGGRERFRQLDRGQ